MEQMMQLLHVCVCVHAQFNDHLRYSAARCSPTFLPPVGYKGSGNLLWPVTLELCFLFVFQTQFQCG